ncbi:MAG: glycerophosphodiester phosphodiesterase [Chitinophagaceae bacterium]
MKFCLLFLSAVLLVNISFCQCTPPIIKFYGCNFIPIGHRGYSLVYPENTILSLEEAFKRGIKYCEVDVSVTKDDQYVLFHDERSLYRTTNGQGKINEKTLSELKLLDAGSWKGNYFKGVKIATLDEALLLAEKYDAHLYLDTKDYRPDLMKKALKKTKVAPNRLMPSIATLSEAAAFRKLLPNTPWIWYDGGNYPANIMDDRFYKNCIKLGCIAFEVSRGMVGDSLWNLFEAKVHTNHSKIWVFTANENADFIFFANNKVDGIETDRPRSMHKLLCNSQADPYPIGLTTGNWQFNSSSLQGVGIGSQLRTLNYSNPNAAMMPFFSTCSKFSIPPLDGQNVNVLKIPAQDSANGVLVYTNFHTEDFGIENGEYTIIMDFLLPGSSAGKWVALYQTGTLNNTDADLFINPSQQIGILENYFGFIKTDTWYRLLFTINKKNEKLRLYLDGAFIGEIAISDPHRWTVYNSDARGEDQGFLIFSDDNRETADIYLSSLQLRNYVTDSLAALKLGKASANGIPCSNADVWNVNIAGSIADSTLLDYENQTWYLLFPSNTNLASLHFNFDVSYGAKATVKPGSVIDLSKGAYELNISPEDTSLIKKWKICARKAL